MILEVVDVIPHDDIIGETTAFFKNLFSGDFVSIMTQTTNRVMQKKERMMSLVTEIPAATVACTSVGLDIFALVMFIIKHITIQTVTSSLAINATSNAVGLASEAFSLMTSAFSLNFFGVGHAIGEILFYLFKD